MLKIVLDTNVLVSGIIGKTGTPAKILDGWLAGRFKLITSPELLSEITEVLHYPHIQQKYGLSESDIDAFLISIVSFGIMTPGELELLLIEDDPDDDKVLAAAVEGGADYIVSGDNHLRGLKAYQGITIISPAEFIGMIGT
jgi:putative PIN family toxin of toxin-antitoxin system